ncbi:hypothetical protein [Diaphorobacter sp.]|nr:hypothetical protein [Diaphorobacter sp.]
MIGTVDPHGVDREEHLGVLGAGCRFEKQNYAAMVSPSVTSLINPMFTPR